jgi:hypothetical protein
VGEVIDNNETKIEEGELIKVINYLAFQYFNIERHLMKVIPVTYLMKVIPVTYLMKVIPVTYLMKVIPVSVETLIAGRMMSLGTNIPPAVLSIQ